MSVMINLSPQMENDVREYVTQDSDELANLFISYLTKELERRREAPPPDPPRRRIGFGSQEGDAPTAPYGRE